MYSKAGEVTKGIGHPIPLRFEIGLHACQFVPKEKGGRGKKGGLKAYAQAIGKQQPHVVMYAKAGKVAKVIHQCIGLADLLGKAQHLAAIHSLPESTWPAMVELLVDRGWSVNDTKERVKRVSEAIAAVPDGQHEHWLDRAEIARRHPVLPRAGPLGYTRSVKAFPGSSGAHEMSKQHER